MPLSLCFVVASMGMAAPGKTMRPTDLKCEFQREPLAIDAAHPRLSWLLESDERDVRQSAYRILVASSSALLSRNKPDLWDSGKRVSAEQNNIPYAGAPLKSGQRCYWKVETWDGAGEGAWSPVATFEMGLLHLGDWQAKWINDGKPNPTAERDFYREDPAPLFRREFDVDGAIKQARLYITGLGYYEAHLNGDRVGDHVLDPGWTKFDKHVFYSVYDVTGQLTRGKNCIGVELGNGWYNPAPLRLFGRINLREVLAIGRPRFIAQLHIEYRDGRTQTVVSDERWKHTDGPVRRNGIYIGEVVDGGREPIGWDHPGFEATKWQPAAVAREPIGTLVAQPQPPIRITKRWKAVAVTQPKPGVFIYDFGTNFGGWASLDLDVAPGTEIHLRYGELLHADGTLNPMTSVAGQIKGRRKDSVESIGGPGAPDIAWQTDTYIARGGGETYTPKFTFHGFRYLEVTGLKQPLDLKSVTAMRLNSDVEQVGFFECSNPLLNQIEAMCRRTFISNIFSVQSDCPHREKMGYGGDIVATSEAMIGTYDMSRFYAKAVQDWADAARPDGMLTDTAPYMGLQYCGVVWAMAHPLLVSQLHQYYGDDRIAQEQYAVAKRWMSVVEAKYPSGIVTDGLSDHESLVPTPAPEYVTPMYFQCANLMADLARRLGKSDDAAHYQTLAGHIKSAYAKFVDAASGHVGTGSQANQAIALHAGIVGEASVSRLVDQIQNHDHLHLTTGILGTKFVLDELSKAGQIDVAYTLATQTDFPSFGWMMKNGATTLWEHWALSENTFSHNHPMFGSVRQWMQNWLGGIQCASDARGFDKIRIQPQTPTGLDWVKSSYVSVRGKIVSEWRRLDGRTEFTIQVPANCRAEVRLPCDALDEIRESGVGAESRWKLRRSPSGVAFEIGSGKYIFEIRRG